MTNMFNNASSLSNTNKGEIHKIFSSNANWPYDWVEFVTYEPITDSNFQAAVNLWFSDEANATYTYGHISDWNVSLVTDMSNAFQNRVSFNENLSGWDVSNVTNMGYMFRESPFNLPLNNWDVSKVTTMDFTFFKAASFNQDLGSWNVARVTTMSNMLRESAYNFPLSNWDVSSVTTMQEMFRDLASYNQLLWPGARTASVTNLYAIFHGCEAFNQDIGSWDTSSVTNMDSMIRIATDFNQDLSDWNVENIPSKPQDFDTGATRWTNASWRPQWGTSTYPTKTPNQCKQSY